MPPRSDKPVAERLQVKAQRRLVVINAPADLDEAIGVAQSRCDIGEADVIVLFTIDRGQFDANVPGLLEMAPRKAILWIAYPKLTSKLAIDLNRDLIRNLVTQLRLETVSQIAIDNDWSALRIKRVP